MDMQASLLSQYLASLKMLEKVIAACPEALWLDESYINRLRLGSRLGIEAEWVGSEPQSPTPKP